VQTLLLWTPNHSCCTFRDADTSNGCSTTHDLPVLIFASVQDREFRSEWHQEREEASSHFRRVIEFGPHDTRKVVAVFGKIEKVTPHPLSGIYFFFSSLPGILVIPWYSLEHACKSFAQWVLLCRLIIAFHLYYRFELGVPT